MCTNNLKFFNYIIHFRHQNPYFIHLKDVITYDNEICLSCHAHAEKIQLLSDIEDPNVISQHEWLPNQKLHFQHVRCIECHTEAKEDMLIPHHIVPKERAVRLCVKCHSANSILMASLYKFQSLEKRNKIGFLNASILNESYVIGANRNYFLNVFTGILFGIVILALFIHAVIRIFK